MSITPMKARGTEHSCFSALTVRQTAMFYGEKNYDIVRGLQKRPSLSLSLSQSSMEVIDMLLKESC